LSYYNLSEGEKKRIDLAILLSFIDLSKKKNSIDINILVFDEIFDTSLDASGQASFISMLEKKIKDGIVSNVFIISHDRNLILPQAETITVYKEAEFSKISS
jgi:energy-coupling factor transporter ATP-binding protein EcfA2